MHRSRRFDHWVVLTLGVAAAAAPSEVVAARPTAAAILARVRSLFERSGGIDPALRERVVAAERIGRSFPLSCSPWLPGTSYDVPGRDVLRTLAPQIKELTQRIKDTPQAINRRTQELQAEKDLELRRVPGYDVYALESAELARARSTFAQYDARLNGRQKVFYMDEAVRALSRRADAQEVIERLEPRRATWRPFEEIEARYDRRITEARVALEAEKTSLERQREALRNRALGILNVALTAAGLPTEIEYGQSLWKSEQHYERFRSSALAQLEGLREAIGPVREQVPLAEKRPYRFQRGACARQREAVEQLTAAITAFEKLAKGYDPQQIKELETNLLVRQNAIRQVWWSFLREAGDKWY